MWRGSGAAGAASVSRLDHLVWATCWFIGARFANRLAAAAAELASWAHLRLNAHVSIENPAGSYLWLTPAFVRLIDAGWPSEQWESCMFGAPWRKPTRLLCSPGWRPKLSRGCTWDPQRGSYSCGHTAKEGPNPHVLLGGGGFPTHVAAEYADGLVEEWALELARLQDSIVKPTAPSATATESTPRLRRHSIRGKDPESAKEVRDKENAACRAGLRNPRFTVQ